MAAQFSGIRTLMSRSVTTVVLPAAETDQVPPPHDLLLGGSVSFRRAISLQTNA